MIKKMKYTAHTYMKLAVLDAVVALFLLLPFFFVRAAGTLQNPLVNINSFSELIEAILDIVVKIGVPIALLAIIYSGFLFVVAQGNEEKLETAKKALLWTVVGTGVLLGAWILAEAIQTTITALGA